MYATKRGTYKCSSTFFFLENPQLSDKKINSLIDSKMMSRLKVTLFESWIHDECTTPFYFDDTSFIMSFIFGVVVGRVC